MELESANVNDIINVDIESYRLNSCEIIYDQKDNDSLVVKVNYNLNLAGEIFVFDPYESIYDEDDEEYIYPIYKSTNKLEVKSFEIYIEIFKSKDGEYRNYKIIDKALIDLTDYLDKMELHCKE